MRRGSRLILALPLVAFAAAIVALATAGSGSGSHTSSTETLPHTILATGGHRVSANKIPLRLTAVPLGALPAAVQDTAVAPAGPGRLALLGGIDATQSSTASITVFSRGSAVDGGTLPAPQHDAQAARLGQDVYVFGGGVVSSYNHILRYDPVTRQVSSAGTLPTDASDVAVAALGDTAYVVGGYTGSSPLDTILAWRPGEPPRVIGHLPQGLRYAAVAPTRRGLIIAGGTAGPSETVSNTIFRFDAATRALTTIGHLPAALTHASAAFLDDQVIVVGGRRALSDDQSDAILTIDPANGRVRRAGRLPVPLSDAAVAASDGRIIVAGGQSPTGPQREIIALVPEAS